jgi:hypothetical protein
MKNLIFTSWLFLNFSLRYL